MRSIRLGLALFALGISTVAGPGLVPVAAAGNNRVMTVERGTPLTEHRASAPRGLTPGRAAGPASPASSAAALASCQGTWSVVPSPNGSGHNDMNAVAAVSANDIWTVGRLSLANGVSQTLSEHWNGNGWSIVASPNTNAGTGDNVLSSVAATATGDAWAVGFARPDQVSARSTLTEHWDGSSWTIAPSPNVLGESNSLFSVKGDAANDYWAVGRSITSTAYHNLAEHWNGIAWAISPVQPSAYTFSQLIAVKVLSSTDVWAVGTQSNDQLNYYPVIQHWNGTSWSVVTSATSGYGNGVLLGIDGTASDLYAVGFGQSTGFDAPFIEHWNGTAWAPVFMVPSDGNTDLNSVVALSATNVWAVGATFAGTNQAPADTTFVVHWDGSNWNKVASPNAGAAADLFDVAAVSPTDIWGVGSYLTSGNYVEQTLSENYCIPPTVSSINPTTGPATGGTSVTITGTGLKWTSGVNFGTAPATNVSVQSDTQVTATSPSGRAGTVDVRIAYSAGQSATSAGDQFTYTATPPGAPTNVVAIAGDASATVYWSPPSFDGGVALTSYTVTPYIGMVAQTPTTVSGSPPPTSATITGLTNGVAYSFKVSATNSAGTGPDSAASDPVTPGRGAFHSLVPCRILDTRTTLGGHPGPLGAGASINVQVAGATDKNGSPCGVPGTGASAAIINVTVTDTTAGSYLTIYPAGIPRPLASNLNWTAGRTVPNLVEVALGKDGALTAYNALGNVNVIFDVAGYVSTPSAVPGVDGLYNPVVPFRVLDTRTTNGGHQAAVGAGETMNLQVGGRSGSNVPATGVSAVVLNVTVTGPTATSYLTVFPMGASRPVASNLNFNAGQTVPNRVIVKVGTNAGTGTSGWVSIYNPVGSVHVIVDVGGWFTDGTDPSATGSLFVGLSPVRVMDTRLGHGAVGPGATMVLTIAGQNGIPSTATAVVMNVTVTDATAGSYLTVFPDGATRPTASDLNYTAGLTVPNLVVVKVGTNGQVDFFNAVGSTDVIVDVVGWYG